MVVVAVGGSRDNIIDTGNNRDMGRDLRYLLLEHFKINFVILQTNCVRYFLYIIKLPVVY